MPAKDPCKRFACSLEDCLKKNSYQEAKCKEALEDLRNCCIQWKGESFVCQGIKIDQPKKP